MHYKNGREAKEGDPIVAQINGKSYAGKIHSLTPGSCCCDAQLAVPIMGGMTNVGLTVGNHYHAEDAFAAIAAAQAAAALAASQPAPDASPAPADQSPANT